MPWRRMQPGSALSVNSGSEHSPVVTGICTVDFAMQPQSHMSFFSQPAGSFLGLEVAIAAQEQLFLRASGHWFTWVVHATCTH